MEATEYPAVCLCCSNRLTQSRRIFLTSHSGCFSSFHAWNTGDYPNNSIMKTQLEGIKMMENPETVWNVVCNKGRKGELEEKNMARCCLIHNIISENLCKISVCIHESPSPRGPHCSASSSAHPRALYPLAVNLCGCGRYICIPSPLPCSPPVDVIVPPHPMGICLTFDPLFPTPGELEEEMENPEMVDLPEKQKHQLRHRELFLSRQLESLPATHIR